MDFINNFIGIAKKNRRTLVYLALFAIALCAVVYEVVFVIGPSYFGDDTVYLWYANMVIHGHFLENPQLFSIRILNIYPIAFFYLLLGVNNLSSAAWAITSFAGSILVAFFIAKELYNEYAGLLAALLLSFFPLFVILSGSPTPNIPEAFLTGFAMLSLIWAIKHNSKAWYFLTGATVVASVLTTQSSGIIFVVMLAYLLLEFIRKRFTINRTSAYLIYGLLIGGFLLLVYNYFKSVSNNPFITFTETEAVYGTAGTAAQGVLINTDPQFYFNVIFPYRILQKVASALSRGILNPVSIWQSIYVPNYNYVGFYFYAFVIATAYLILRRERRTYIPLLWFAIAFLYLEFGPMYVSLAPFKYILSHRLERYLTIVSIPMAITLSIAIVKMTERKSGWKRAAAYSLSAIFILFLILTAIPINLFWHSIVRYETYDQMSIATYLNALPDTTKVYLQSGFANVEVYMHYDNLTRFYVYDNIKNCNDILRGSYVIIPKYVKISDLNYTPDPLVECPYWVSVLYPKIQGNFSSEIIGPAAPLMAQLFYVPPDS